jgi:23S rRNA (uracil1939-C5)-methyltransferase
MTETKPSDDARVTSTNELDVEVSALAAGGDGVARDAGGRVTFVPRTAPGDLVRVRLVKQTKSFARGELVEVMRPSTLRVAPPCEYFIAGCGGCQWQHVERAGQLAAKHSIVTAALRKLPGLVVEDVLDPAPPYGWRRRARFHVHAGKLGLYAYGSRQLIPIAHCPQVEPALDAALRVIVPLTPPDGELAMVRGHRGEIVVAAEHAWRGAAKLVGRAQIVGVIAGNDKYGETVIEIEPGLSGGPWDFAQASAAGNAALIATVCNALGEGAGRSSGEGAGRSSGEGAGPSRGNQAGRLLELHAGAGNFTRGFVDHGWNVIATDVAVPPKPIAGVRFEVGATERVLERVAGPFDAIVLDPPRTGALEAMAGIAKHAPGVVVYISCDPATLARDAQRLVDAGYRAERAWPVDLMPQTSHVEVVLRLVHS